MPKCARAFRIRIVRAVTAGTQQRSSPSQVERHAAAGDVLRCASRRRRALPREFADLVQQWFVRRCTSRRLHGDRGQSTCPARQRLRLRSGGPVRDTTVIGPSRTAKSPVGVGNNGRCAACSGRRSSRDPSRRPGGSRRVDRAVRALGRSTAEAVTCRNTGPTDWHSHRRSAVG
jgi:hypothetical protein